MNPRISIAPLVTDTQVEAHVGLLLDSAITRRFWLLFLDAEHRPTETIVPVDDIPELPAWDDAVRLAPMFSFLAGAEDASAVIVVLERPGGDPTLSHADRAWTRSLRAAAETAGLPVRASLLLHDGGTRWLAPDDWM